MVKTCCGVGFFFLNLLKALQSVQLEEALYAWKMMRLYRVKPLWFFFLNKWEEPDADTFYSDS
jgi:hypothetical protein